MDRPSRILVVDDSIAVRRLIAKVIEAEDGLELAGMAEDGVRALALLETERIDAMTLDVEMPNLDGIGLLKELRARRQRLPIIMLSSHTERGALTTLDCLALGAADYLVKPQAETPQQIIAAFQMELLPKLRALVGGSIHSSAELPQIQTIGRVGIPRALVIGSSTGGPQALEELLTLLAQPVTVPIIIVQHMPVTFTRLLAERLDAKLPMRVSEAVDGQEVHAGEVIIAPGDHHLTMSAHGRSIRLALDREPQVHGCRPAVDRLFRSAAAALGGGCIAVVLTGMGVDGLAGCYALKHQGAKILVQDSKTSAVWGMPGAVAKAGLADDVCTVPAIAQKISGILAGRTLPITG